MLRRDPESFGALASGVDAKPHGWDRTPECDLRNREFGSRGEKAKTPAELARNAKRRETNLSAILVNGSVGQFRGRMKSSNLG